MGSNLANVNFLKINFFNDRKSRVRNRLTSTSNFLLNYLAKNAIKKSNNYNSYFHSNKIYYLGVRLLPCESRLCFELVRGFGGTKGALVVQRNRVSKNNKNKMSQARNKHSRFLCDSLGFNLEGLSQSTVRLLLTIFYFFFNFTLYIK